MEGLIRKISEMKLSMEIIDGYNDNAKDYCESLLERVKNANIKKYELDCLLDQYYKEVEEQEVLLKLLEDRKEKLMSLQNKKIPRCVLNEESTLSNQDHIIKEITNMDISLREKICSEPYKTKENINPFFEPLMVNSTFTEGTPSFANSTFLKREHVNVTPKPRKDLEVSVSFVTNEEFSQIPGFLVKELTVFGPPWETEAEMDTNDTLSLRSRKLTKKAQALSVKPPGSASPSVGKSSGSDGKSKGSMKSSRLARLEIELREREELAELERRMEEDRRQREEERRQREEEAACQELERSAAIVRLRYQLQKASICDSQVGDKLSDSNSKCSDITYTKSRTTQWVDTNFISNNSSTPEHLEPWSQPRSDNLKLPIAQKVNPSKLEINSLGWEFNKGNNIQSSQFCEPIRENQSPYEHYLMRKVIGKELPAFSGDPSEWLNFIVNFRRSTVIGKFSPEENLIRLQNSLKGRARESVSALLCVPGSVEEIIRTLELQYGRPDIIIKNLIGKVRKFPIITDDKMLSLIDLSTKVSNFVTSLTALKYEAYLNNPQLVEEIVEKLPSHLKLQWGEELSMSQGNKYSLVALKEWLFKKASAITLAFSTFSEPKQRVHLSKESHDIGKQGKEVNTVRYKCVVCNSNDHKIRQCNSFKNMSVDDRRSLVRKRNLCFSCLGKNHKITKCKSLRECSVENCTSNHNPLLHLDNKEITGGAQVPEVVANSVDQRNTLLKILEVEIKGPNGVKRVHALLDEGSTSTFLDQCVATELGIRGSRSPLCVQWIQDVSRRDEDSQIVSFTVSGVGKFKKWFNLRRVRTVSNLALPSQTFHVEDITKTFPTFKYNFPECSIIQYEPKLLIGQDYWCLIESLQTIRNSWNGLAVTKTRLDWVVHGNRNVDKQCCSVEVNKLEQDELHDLVKQQFQLDTYDASKSPSSLSGEELKAVKMFDETLKYLGDRWEVGLLWKNSSPLLEDNKACALKWLYCVERKMDRDEDFCRQYTEKINEYLVKGYARKLSRVDLLESYPRVWYLPHLAVFNPIKPGKIRIVFDASAKSNGISLNDNLLKGPDIYNSLPGILMRSRIGQIAFCGDIKEMFLQIKIRNEDQMCQRFLWRDRSKARAPEVYVMQVMLLGAACSPFQAQEIRNRNATRFLDKYPLAVHAIHTNHYMDDYLDSTDTESSAISLIKQVIAIHRSGGFQMRNWVFNSKAVLEAINLELGETINAVSLDMSRSEKVLGMRWVPDKDALIFHFMSERLPSDVLMGSRRPTKRELLRVVMSVFDPLGLLGFLIIKAKTLIQDVWRIRCEWDDVIDEKFQTRWNDWLEGLRGTQKFHIPRCYSTLLSRAITLELHIFSDASDRAYASVAYVRGTGIDGRVFVSLVAAKTRVGPIKQISIPRLELQAAVMGCRLAKFIKAESGLKIESTTFWTDSCTVLYWIRNSDRRYRMFVGHRLAEIVENSNPNSWRWVPSAENPADDGTKLKICSGDKWLSGPPFLLKSVDCWPEEHGKTEKQSGQEASEILTLIITSSGENTALPDISRFSNWLRLMRTTAYVRRFIARCRGTQKADSFLTCEELQEAEKLWWKEQQKSDFSQEISLLFNHKVIEKHSKLYRLTPTLDHEGIMRVSGRISNAHSIDRSIVAPVILDSKNNLVRLLIKWYHDKAGHQGQETVANEIRQRYCIIGLRRAIKRCWNSCNFCQRRRARPMEQQMADLPRERLDHHNPPFTNTGMDYFGPLWATVKRSREKRYGVLFTCLTTRAIHLEIARDLSTDSTLMAIRRFIGRRGCPKVMWSDNGTNLKGAWREIKEYLCDLDEHRIGENLALKGISWKFIPPSAPHMGGSWERLVRSVKIALEVTLKEVAPKDDVLETLFIEAEHIVNSRPLTKVSEDPADLDSITPNYFLIGSSNGAPMWTQVDEPGDLRKKWRHAQFLADHFWKRWLKEYLPTLLSRTKWFDNKSQPYVGQLVNVIEPNGQRGTWNLGKITNVYPGKDGRIRVVDVKTKDGLFKRPISRLAPLNIEESCNSTKGGGCSYSKE